MGTLWIRYMLGALCLADLTVHVLSLQCYELSCNGTNCLAIEVVHNPLLIKKCSRVIYKGCYTVTTTFSGFTLTTAGCVDRTLECSARTCSGTFLKTKVSCCNEDLCNDGEISSAAGLVPLRVTTTSIIWCLVINTLIAKI